MKEYEHIEQLVERFLDGATSNEEERKLYAFFAGDGVPECLQAYREMFLWFGEGAKAEFTEQYICPEESPRPKRRFGLRMAAATALAAAGIVAVFCLVRPAETSEGFDPFEGSYIVRNGVKITDPDIVRPKAEAVLKAVEEEELLIALKLFEAHRQEFAYAYGELERERQIFAIIRSFPEGEARQEVCRILSGQE